MDGHNSTSLLLVLQGTVPEVSIEALKNVVTFWFHSLFAHYSLDEMIPLLSTLQLAFYLPVTSSLCPLVMGSQQGVKSFPFTLP